MKPGTRVKMSEHLKKKLRTYSPEHVVEFGKCEGLVECLTNYGSCEGPEVDVRWFPSKLRYAYHPADLEIA